MTQHLINIEHTVTGETLATTRLPCGKLVLVEGDTNVDALGNMIHHLQERRNEYLLMLDRAEAMFG